ncbi:MAG: bacteriocin [Deltaproteobacteria bacterium]|nr:bacteriocin [Deltaproteobacteria bacterium]
MTTISNDQLANVTGGGSVDYSLQSRWISQSTAAMGRAGLGSRFNNGGLNGVRNPDMTNVIRFPGG